MKIIFVCGALEPGRNGVGDYTRRLAVELKKNGHQTALIALNDPFCNGVIEETQEMEGSEVVSLRLGSGELIKTSFSRAALCIDRFNPDWLSLQYVPYSFNSKGLPVKLTKNLVKLGNGRRWQIMFHELWVGMEKKASVKTLFLKNIQKQLIRSMIFRLRPGVIHTQSSLYLDELEKLGFKARYLPLFSNIPNSKNLNNQIARLDQQKNNLLVLFGSVHPQAPVQSFAEEVAEIVKKKGYRISLILLGRCGSEQEDWINIWEANGLEVKVYGEQSPENISKILQNSFAGISTTPVAKLEKSGAVAAMREHGLPVICASRTWQPQNDKSLKLPPGTIVYKKGNLGVILSNLPHPQYDTGVTGIAQQFINSLHSETLRANTVGGETN